MVCAGILGTEGSQPQDNVFTVCVLPSKKWNPRAGALVSAILSLGRGLTLRDSGFPEALLFCISKVDMAVDFFQSPAVGAGVGGAVSWNASSTGDQFP